MYSWPPLRIVRRSDPLPVILEDNLDYPEDLEPPPIPPRAWNRPVQNKLFWLGPAPRLYESSPPAYTLRDSIDYAAEKGRVSSVRNNRHVARRGGWKKLGMLALVILLCVISLSVGLALGLRHRHNNSTNNSTSVTSVNTTFPAGSYRFSTFLSTVAANCTSNPSTWRCYPYSTYSESPNDSAASFDWIITPVPNTSNYVLSSTPNPFSILITGASLSLQNIGTEQENYYFSIPLTKTTRPAVALGEGNEAATCSFANTIVEAHLYTKMPKTYPEENDTAVGIVGWRNAVSISQVATSGPSCVDANKNSLGSFNAVDEGACQCLYQNSRT